LLAGLALVSLCLTANAQSLPTEGAVKPREIRKIYADGKHNAFTALVRWKDAYWLAFRHAARHNSTDGEIVILRSDDAKEWKEVRRINVLPDDRDPQFLATEKRLFLYDPALEGRELTTYALYTDDGTTWSKPRAVYEPRYIIWKPITHRGSFWSAAHKKDDTATGGKSRDVHLVTSSDGLEWKKVSTIRAGNWESETTLHFDGDRAVAFLRQKYGSPPAQVLTADAPYQEWTGRPAPINHFSGHSCHTFRGVTYLLTRTMDYAKREAGQAIYTYETDGSLKLYCVLPAGGDCAYAEAVEAGDDMLVSYYSGHETDKPAEKTNIYLAVVPLKK
jgi:hypothetical protein